MTDGIWTAERDFSLYGLAIGTRMTVVRLPEDRGLWLHSPIAVDEPLRSALDAEGEVKHIVAPNRVHHLFLADWVAAYPKARLYGPQGLDAKRKDLEFHEILAESPPDDWGGVFRQLFVRGAPPLGEVAFLHSPTRTLLLTDLVFYFDEDAPLATRLAMRALGCYKRARFPRDPGVFVKDKRALRESIDRILEWDFDRIVISHGKVIEQDGRAVLRDAFAWLR